jgi:hypothetical protein
MVHDDTYFTFLRKLNQKHDNVIDPNNQDIITLQDEKKVKNKNVSKGISVTGCGGPWGCETLSVPHYLDQRFSNFFEVGTTFISQNISVDRLTLVPFESKFIIF